MRRRRAVVGRRGEGQTGLDADCARNCASPSYRARTVAARTFPENRIVVLNRPRRTVTTFDRRTVFVPALAATEILTRPVARAFNKPVTLNVPRRNAADVILSPGLARARIGFGVGALANGGVEIDGAKEGGRATSTSD